MLKALKVLFATMILAAACAADAAVTVVLKPEAEVASTRITLADVAQISGAGAPDKLRTLDLGRSPFPGYTATVDAGKVRLMMKAAGIDPSGVQMDAASRCRVSRASQTVSGHEVAAAALAEVEARWQGDDRVECSVLREPSDVNVAAGTLELAVKISSTIRPGVNSVPVEIRVDGERERSVSVSIQVRAFRPVVVAANALGRGQMISAGDLAVEEREMAGFTSGLMMDPSAAVGQRTIRAISAGAPLRESDLEVIPLVRRNGPVAIIARSGRVSVRSNGQALDDGQLGQLVKVRPDHTSDAVSGKVIAEGVVEIAFQ